MWTLLGFLATILICVLILKFLGIMVLVGAVLLFSIYAWWQVRKFSKRKRS